MAAVHTRAIGARFTFFNEVAPISLFLDAHSLKTGMGRRHGLEPLSLAECAASGPGSRRRPKPDT
jgi:hypothetical protein